jgi:hypothetical protein
VYTERNYKTKKELTAAFAAGKMIAIFQPGPFGGGPINGNVALEGPHYPQPHKWYASGTAKDSVLVTLGGKTVAQLQAKIQAKFFKDALKCGTCYTCVTQHVDLIKLQDDGTCPCTDGLCPCGKAKGGRE